MIEQLIKKYLYNSLGIKSYLQMLYKAQAVSFDTFNLRKNLNYDFAYFYPKLIKEGNVVLDIGANIGYHTRIFQRLVGENGQVIAVEPIKIYADNIKWALGHHKNVIVYNCAIGKDETKKKFFLKEIDGVLRPKQSINYTSKKDSDDSDASINIIEVNATQVSANNLFKDLKQLDYIKCEINNQSQEILEDMETIIREFLPLVQLSTSGEHLKPSTDILYKYGYHKYKLHEGKLVAMEQYDVYPYEYLFIPFIHKEKYLHLMAKK